MRFPASLSFFGKKGNRIFVAFLERVERRSERLSRSTTGTSFEHLFSAAISHRLDSLAGGRSVLAGLVHFALEF